MKKVLLTLISVVGVLLATPTMAEDCFVSGKISGMVVNTAQRQALARVNGESWYVAPDNVQDFNDLFRVGDYVQICRTWYGVVLKSRTKGYQVAVFQP